MRVMVFVKATEDSERGFEPTEDAMAAMRAMGAFNDALEAAGILIAGEGLKPSSEARRVAFEGTDRRVTEGPFLPAEELVAGYWLWEVSDMEEAIAWVKRCPNPMRGPSVIEIRPIYTADDLKSASN